MTSDSTKEVSDDKPNDGDGTFEIKNAKGEVLQTHPAQTLRGAFLGKAYLRGAQLRGADLRGADLSDADLRDADLTGADLRDATLTDARFEKANLFEADLRGAELHNTPFDDATMVRADLEGCKNEYGDGTSFTRAKMMRANLKGVKFDDVDFSRADLRRANFTGASLSGVKLNGADLRNTDFRDATLGGIQLNEAIMYRTDLSVARSVYVDVRKKWSACFDATTKWPSSSPLLRFKAVPWIECLIWSLPVAMVLFFVAGVIGFLVSLVGGPSWDNWAMPALVFGFVVTLAILLSWTVFQRFFHTAMDEQNAWGTYIGLKAITPTNAIIPAMDIDLSNSPLSGKELHDVLKRLNAPVVEAIDLRWTAVTDEHLEWLGRMSNLLFVDLTGTKVTEAGFGALAESHPRCEIAH